MNEKLLRKIMRMEKITLYHLFRRKQGKTLTSIDIQVEVYGNICRYFDLQKGVDYLFYDENGLRGIDGSWILHLAGDIIPIAYEYLDYGNKPINRDKINLGDWTLIFGDRCLSILTENGEKFTLSRSYSDHPSSTGIQID